MECPSLRLWGLGGTTQREHSESAKSKRIFFNHKGNLSGSFLYIL
jgi:hypothetical protein